MEKECREDLYKDFEQLTLDFYHKGNLYGLEKYWYVLPAFAHFGNLGQNHWNWTNSYYDMEIKLYNCSWVFKFAVDQAKYLGRRLKLDSALARLVNGKGSNFEGKGVARNSRGKSDI